MSQYLSLVYSRYWRYVSIEEKCIKEIIFPSVILELQIMHLDVFKVFARIAYGLTYLKQNKCTMLFGGELKKIKHLKLNKKKKRLVVEEIIWWRV